MTSPSYPILYSFRRCPYAMRARLAIYSSGIQCELREVILKDKPTELITVSPKATVPVLVTKAGEIIDESIDIMKWALQRHDPSDYWQALTEQQYQLANKLIQQNDSEFKHYLDRYKYADLYPEHDQDYYCSQAQVFLAKLESQLTQHPYLLSDKISLADLAIFPFIRQFAFVDEIYFSKLPYPKLQTWLQSFLDSSLFSAVMNKYSQWHKGDEITLFPN